MKNIVISIKNTIVADAIENALDHTSDFRSVKVLTGNPSDILTMALSINADILLMDVSLLPDTVLSKRLETSAEVKKRLPYVKIALICDSNSNPEAARRIKSAKQAGQIDIFFYESVTANYLTDMLDSL